jgi:hypothetical protein
MSGRIALVGSLVGCILLPALALSIASFIIAAQNKDVTCDRIDGDSSGSEVFMQLSVWLNVYGGVSLGMIGLLVIAIALLLCGTGAGVAIYITMLILYQLFTFAWNIIGAVILFRDSMNCLKEAQSIWIMVLCVLIVQWLGFLHSCSRWSRNFDD